MAQPPKIIVIHQEAQPNEIGCTTIIAEVTFTVGLVIVAVVFWYIAGGN